MAEVDPNARYVPLEGLALAIFTISIVCLVFSVLAVGGRTYSRLKDGIFGLDDGLVVFGTLAYIAGVGLACYACCVGVGSVNSKHNAFMAVESMKYFTIWILVYVVSLATIKSSICVTLLRIANTQKRLRVAIWVLLTITWASFIVTFVGVLLFCRPIEANWDTSLLASGATCAPMEVMVGLSHTATASTIVTDVGCVVLPGLVLWNVQMKFRAKLNVFVLLSFASLASIMTICRAPYINRYNYPADNLMFWVGHIVLFSNIETAIGCIATSIPTLRVLFKIKNGSSNQSDQIPEHNGPRSLVTFGRAPVNGRNGGRSRNMFRNPTDTGLSFATVHAKGGDWERLKDGDSDKRDLLEDNRDGNKIRADYTYAVELSQSPKHNGKSFLEAEEAKP